ncbi:hypothetical protein MWU77_06755 [Rhodococcus sp. F64268]|uniref:O-antigen ligase family protein n=1 Tax=Rhodococcus sp. F64268 TaxID=2926402 RepID=UPI001FF217AA|nr:hypothetical protein [Rhodococcus sp. F64268]MCK0090484.1 hypothetical protein [Rhodococcus sp. F64268]
MAESLIALIGALACYLLGVMVVIRWPQVGFGAIALFMATAWHIPQWPSVLNFLGLSASVPDFLCAVLATAMLVTAVPSGSRLSSRGIKIAVQVFLAMLVFSVVRGLWYFGFASALNEVRPWLYIVIITVWTVRTLVDHDEGQRWAQAWIIYSGVLVMFVGLINVAQFGLGSASTAVRSSSGDILEAGRPITSGQAVALAACVVVSLWTWRATKRRLYLPLSLGAAICVVVAQHRSVWVALAAALVVSLLAIEVHHRLVTIFATCVGAVSIILLSNGGLLGQIPDLLSSSASDSRTYAGRVYDWLVLINRSVRSGPQTIIFGFPSGTGWWRYREDGLRIGYIPHNWYVATYLRVGIVGLVGMLAIAWIAIVRNWKAPLNGANLSLIALILVYGWAYNFQWYLAPLLGVIIWSSFFKGARISNPSAPSRPMRHDQIGISAAAGGRNE